MRFPNSLFIRRQMIRSRLRDQRRGYKSLAHILKNHGEKRNIGIIAHIDAGKTTVTERVLYLSGVTQDVGDVDHGNTVTDFMELEREKGITIQSAAVSTMWKKRRINIIDTPGHVDFTLEVERALRVMDGTVTILDGSAGVQAQTLTVWRQASKFNLPSVFYVNKMDKPNANFERSVESIESRLCHSVVPVVVPVYDGGRFVGAVNLLIKKFLNIWSFEKESVWSDINDHSIYGEVFAKGWDNLLSKLSEVDSSFEKLVLLSSNVSAEDVLKSLRKASLNSVLSPVACGTALRNTRSVEPLLDMIVDFLPNPSERQYELPVVDLCALVFKVRHDKRYGRLHYARVYKGQLHNGESVLNVNRDERETNVRLFAPFSDVLEPVNVVGAGDVTVLTGLKATVTGDTLVDTNAMSSNKYILEGIDSPDPVFSCAIEPPSSASTAQFEQALRELEVEDPSLRFRKDPETAQLIVDGMGELHIEVVKERLKREYGLNVFMGPLRIGYREILNETVTHLSYTEDTFGDQQQWVSMRAEFAPTKRMKTFQQMVIDIDDDEESPVVRNDWLKVLNDGCKLALYNGPLHGCPVGNLIITLKALSTSGNRVNSALLSACASRCVKEALRRGTTSLIEPVMRVEVSLLADRNGRLDAASASVLHELGNRRAEIVEVDESVDGQMMTINAKMPLSETVGVAKRIRELSSGLCSIHMEFSEYQKVLPAEQAEVMRKHFSQ